MWNGMERYGMVGKGIWKVEERYGKVCCGKLKKGKEFEVVVLKISSIQNP